MAKKSGLGDNFYISGYDLSGDVGALSKIALPCALLDVTAIDKYATERRRGLKDGSIDFNTWFNDAKIADGDPTDQEHIVLKGLPRTDVIALYYRGTILGGPVAAILGKHVNYDWVRGADGSLQGTVQVLGQGSRLEWCESLTVGKRTDVAATNGASVDYGAVDTKFGLSAYLEVFAFDGTDVTVKLQDSANDAAWDDIVDAAFAQITIAAPPGQAQRIEIGLTATVRRYVRAVTVTTGGFASLVFAVAFDRYLGARDP